MSKTDKQSRSATAFRREPVVDPISPSAGRADIKPAPDKSDTAGIGQAAQAGTGAIPSAADTSSAAGSQPQAPHAAHPPYSPYAPHVAHAPYPYPPPDQPFWNSQASPAGPYTGESQAQGQAAGYAPGDPPQYATSHPPGFPPPGYPPGFPPPGHPPGYPPNNYYAGAYPAETPGGRSSSSLHAAFIIVIVFVGLAIGLANFIWTNDQREAKEAQALLARKLSAADNPERTGFPANSNAASADPADSATPVSSGSPANSAPPATDRKAFSNSAGKSGNHESASGNDLESGLFSESDHAADGILTPSLSLPQALERMAMEERQAAAAPPTEEAKQSNKSQARNDKLQPHKPRDEDTPVVQEGLANTAPAVPVAPAASSTTTARKEKNRRQRQDAQPRKLADGGRKDRLKEIDRVRSQAFSESSKDRMGERRPGSPESRDNSRLDPQSERRKGYRSSDLVQRTVTSTQYARCERNANLIERERCKWQLCNNKWGKGGCPSFKPERSYIF